eukprot:m51a1_g14648 hypothetical protein (973) ;mRNA; f:91366-99153
MRPVPVSAQRQRCLTERLCFTCQQPGHTSKDCPVKAEHPRSFTPPRAPPRPAPEFARTELDQMLSLHVFEPSASPWAAPIHVAMKKNGKFRLCMDYTLTNRAVEPDAYPNKDPRELFDFLAGKPWFGIVDLSYGFYQVPLAPDSREILAFTTPWGLFQPTRLMFGVNNGPPHFQRCMDSFLRDLYDYWRSFVDDCICAASTFEDFLHAVEQFLSKCIATNTHCNAAKSSFSMDYLRCLGRIVGPDTISNDPERLEPLRDLTVDQLRAEACPHGEFLVDRVFAHEFDDDGVCWLEIRAVGQRHSEANSWVAWPDCRYAPAQQQQQLSNDAMDRPPTPCPLRPPPPEDVVADSPAEDDGDPTEPTSRLYRPRKRPSRAASPSAGARGQRRASGLDTIAMAMSGSTCSAAAAARLDELLARRETKARRDFPDPDRYFREWIPQRALLHEVVRNGVFPMYEHIARHYEPADHVAAFHLAVRIGRGDFALRVLAASGCEPAVARPELVTSAAMSSSVDILERFARTWSLGPADVSPGAPAEALGKFVEGCAIDAVAVVVKRFVAAEPPVDAPHVDAAVGYAVGSNLLLGASHLRELAAGVVLNAGLAGGDVALRRARAARFVKSVVEGAVFAGKTLAVAELTSAVVGGVGVGVGAGVAAAGRLHDLSLALLDDADAPAPVPRHHDDVAAEARHEERFVARLSATETIAALVTAATSPVTRVHAERRLEALVAAGPTRDALLREVVRVGVFEMLRHVWARYDARELASALLLALRLGRSSLARRMLLEDAQRSRQGGVAGGLSVHEYVGASLRAEALEAAAASRDLPLLREVVDRWRLGPCDVATDACARELRDYVERASADGVAFVVARLVLCGAAPRSPATAARLASVGFSVGANAGLDESCVRAAIDSARLHATLPGDGDGDAAMRKELSERFARAVVEGAIHAGRTLVVEQLVEQGHVDDCAAGAKSPGSGPCA